MADYTLKIIVQGEDQTGPASQGMERLGAGGVAAGALIASALQAAAGAVTGFVGGAITAAGDFQQNLNVLQAASGATTAQMEQMRTLAVALGNDMTLPGASASDAATAMLELSKAGLSVNDTMAAAKGTLQLAAAAETDAATAAQVVSGALNAFHLEGAAAAQIADQLAAGANASAASMTDLSQGFQQAGFAFNATGQHTDDLITALAELTNVGLTGSDAGTALKNAMMQLMAPTSQAAATMRQYGINVRDAQGNMLPFRDIIGVLQTQLGGLTAAQREAALKTILQGDGMKAMLPLLQAGVTGFDAMKVKVNEAGAAQNMAAAQMQGFNGAMAGMSNAVETLQLIIGGALLPVLTDLANTASNIIGVVTTFVQALMGSADAFQQLGPVAQFAVNALQSVGQIFSDLAGEAVAWGENIVGSLASGMMAAADAVMSVLGSIGNMIAGLLMPGSPPKLLPGLTDWGTGAINAYMEGWGKADFGVFNSISDSIQGALEGIAKASGNKGMNVASIVLGSQDDIAKAINEVHTLGSVSEETFNSIIAAAGPAGPQISSLVRSYFDLEAATQNVAAAQSELNNITAEYSAKLDPLNQQLKGIQNQKQLIQDQQRLAKLYEEAGAAAEGSAEKQIKTLEIQELQTRMQIKATEQERDTAVGAAQDKLDAAKKQQQAAQVQVDSQKALLDVNKKQNDLIAQQTKAMSGAAGAMKGAANAMKPLADAAEAVKGPVQAVSAAVDSVNAAASATAATVTSTVSPAFQAFQAAVAPVGAFLQDNLVPVLLGIGTAITVAVLPAIISFIGTLAAGAAAAIMAAGSFLLMLAPFIAIGVAAAALAAAWQSNFGGIQQIIQPIVDAVVNGFGEGGILGAINGLVTGLTAAWPAIVAWFSLALTTIVAQVSTWGQALVDWIAPYIPIALAALNTWIAGVWAWVQEQVPIWLAQLMAWGQSLVDWIAPYIPPALEALGGLATSILGWIGEQAGPLLEKFGTWAQSIVDWIPGATVDFLAAWPGMFDQFLSWIGEQAGPLLEKLGDWALQFVAWVAPKIPDVIAAVAGIAAAILVWIGETVITLGAKLIEWGPPFYDWVHKEAIPKLLTALGEMGGNIIGWITDTIKTAGDEAKKIGKSIIDGIKKSVEDKAKELWEAAKSAVMGALKAAKDALGIHSPSKVMADAVGSPIVQGIAEGIKAATPQAVAAMSDVAGKLLDTVTKGVDAFAKLRQMGEVPDSAINAFVSALTRVVQGFDAAMQSVGTKMLASAGEFAKGAGGVVDLVGKAVDALGKLATFRAISESTIGAFADALMSTITHLVEAFATFDVKALAGAAGFAEGAGKVLAIVGSGVDAFNKLSTMGSAVPGMFLRFATYVRVLVNRMVEMSDDLDGTALAAAVAFAEGAGKIIAIVGTAVDAFGKMAGMGEAIPGMFLRFALYVRVLVGRMAEAAADVGQDALAEAVRFADGAGKIIAVVAAGVAAFDKLGTMGEAVPGMFARFALYVRVLVGRMAEAADDLSSGALAAAVQFAEGAGKVIGVIKVGVEGFNALGSFVAPTWDSMALFRQALGQWVGAMVQLAEWFEGVSLEAAVAFSDAAGKVVGILKAGVDGFTALDDLGPVSEAAIANFATAVNQTMVLLGAAASQFSADAIAQAGKFAEAAGKAVGILKTGTEGLLMLDTFTGVSEAAVKRFADGVRLAVAAMAALAVEFGPEATAAANAFAKAAGESTDFLKKGVEGFIKLGDLKDIPAAGLRLFAQGIVAVVQTIGQLSTILTTEALAQAVSVANGTDTVIETIKNALKAFILLGQAASEIPNYVASFQTAVNTLSGNMQRLVVPASQNLGQQIALGIAAGITSGTPAIVNAVLAAVDAALTAAEQALGIASPSKVFAELGAQTSAGMAQGAVGGIPEVRQAIGQVSSAATAAGGRGVASQQTTSTTTFAPGAIVVNAAPGQSVDAIADAVARKLGQRVAMRGI